MTKLINYNLQRYDWPSVFTLDSYFYPSFLRPFFDIEPLAAFAKSSYNKSYSISFDVPGFKADEVNVEIQDGFLTVDAKNKTRSYRQSISLPRELDTSAPNAELKDGVLSVQLARKQLPQSQKIAIKSGV